MYAVYHVYETEGEFGDAIGQEELVALCDNETLAKEWAKKFDRTHVYDKSYDELHCGTLLVRSLNDIFVLTEKTKNISPWEKIDLDNPYVSI